MVEKNPTILELIKVIECCSSGTECGVCIARNTPLCDEWVDKVANLIRQQQKEIERLTEERQNIVDKYNQADEAVDHWFEMYKQTKTENAELQKQVDELTERYLEESKERLEFEQRYKKIQHAHNIGLGSQRSQWEKKVQQAVKDTAKEILEWLLGKAYVNKCIDLHVNEVKAKFRERYGVEVE